MMLIVKRIFLMERCSREVVQERYKVKDHVYVLGLPGCVALGGTLGLSGPYFPPTWSWSL